MFAAVALAALHLIPRPASLAAAPCARPFDFARPLRIGSGLDPAAEQTIDDRWRALGIPALQRGAAPDVRVERAALPAQAYDLRISGSRVLIRAAGATGAFYAADTLAQLPVRQGAHWVLPCVNIHDAPALRWRVLSDDVSRGPLPTMRYFKERIRTLAAFKFNGYSPYMEHVFADPRDPLPAPLDGITPAQLHDLAAYAKRFHVAFIPEQQTFAHMHGTLQLEEFSGDAELPHGFLFSPASPNSSAYETGLIRDELAQTGPVPFFHIGSDETSMLGAGRSSALVKRLGRAKVYADHVDAMNQAIAASGARVMLWSDGAEADPAIMKLLPHGAVLIDWHYDSETTYVPHIESIARGGFDQMVDPGDDNWNQVFPDVRTAMQNNERFIDEGKAAHVLGLFQSTWNDDGSSLFEATWYPVLFSGACAWQTVSCDPQSFSRDFPSAFFGVDDPGYARDVDDLADAQSRMAGMYDYSSDFLLGADPFDPGSRNHMSGVDVHAVRLESEAAERHLMTHEPPLHRNAARVMFLAAREDDVIGRKFQAAAEISQMYPKGDVRDLLWSKYWFWELRDDYEELSALYARAWRYEDRPSHLQSSLERYRLAAQRADARASRIERAMMANDNGVPLPPLASILKGP